MVLRSCLVSGDIVVNHEWSDLEKGYMFTGKKFGFSLELDMGSSSDPVLSHKVLCLHLYIRMFAHCQTEQLLAPVNRFHTSVPALRMKEIMVEAKMN